MDRQFFILTLICLGKVVFNEPNVCFYTVGGSLSTQEVMGGQRGLTPSDPNKDKQDRKWMEGCLL